MVAAGGECHSSKPALRRAGRWQESGGHAAQRHIRSVATQVLCYANHAAAGQ